MEKVITKDSSVTFYSEKYKETYRSISGAEEESVKKFVEPAKVAEKAKSGRIDILDVCFGLGYNSAAAIDAALKSNPNCKVSVLGLENDTEIISKIEEVNPSFQSYKIIKKLIKMHEISEKNIHIKLIIGDARNTIKQLNTKFNVIFHDPFSPKACPELWTEEFFKDIAKVSQPGTILTTYSCARIVRDNLNKAGFNTEDGPCIGRKAPSTIAYF